MTRYAAGVWVWADALDLLRNGERLPQRYAPPAASDGVPCWQPAVDLYEQDEGLTLFVALPGVSSRQIEVVVAGDELIVRGRRPIPEALRKAAIHRLEIPYGRFERRVPLPPGRFRVHQQFFEDGCLVLVVRPL